MHKAYHYHVTAIISVLLLVFSLGCSKTPDDATIAGQVQSKIASDPNFAGRTINVQSNNGVVTLTGTVADEFQRQAAANYAASVGGVRTVVNNLSLGTVGTAIPTQPAAAEPYVSRTRAGATKKTAQSPVTPRAEAPAATSAAPVSPQPISVPEGTVLTVRMIDGIDSDKNQVGDTFAATVETPITIGDRLVVPKGADVQGRVVAAKSGGKFTGRPEIGLTLTKLTVGGRSYELSTGDFAAAGSSRGKQTAVAVGGGAAAGAIIGAIAGGGKGAAIGAAAGAGAGTGVQAIRKAGQVKVTSEAILDFHLQKPVFITPPNAAAGDRTQIK